MNDADLLAARLERLSALAANRPQDAQTGKRVDSDIQRNGNEGIGKPELLRHGLSGYWSRRFTSEHRLVYKIQGKDLLLVQLRYHY